MPDPLQDTDLDLLLSHGGTDRDHATVQFGLSRRASRGQRPPAMKKGPPAGRPFLTSMR